MTIQVISEHIEPERPERKLPAPQWVLDGPARAIVMELDPDGMLYRHQSIGLAKLTSPEANLVISTGTASGKTLIFQIATPGPAAQEPRGNRTCHLSPEGAVPGPDGKMAEDAGNDRHGPGSGPEDRRRRATNPKTGANDQKSQDRPDDP